MEPEPESSSSGQQRHQNRSQSRNFQQSWRSEESSRGSERRPRNHTPRGGGGYSGRGHYRRGDGGGEERSHGRGRRGGSSRPPGASVVERKSESAPTPNSQVLNEFGGMNGNNNLNNPIPLTELQLDTPSSNETFSRDQYANRQNDRSFHRGGRHNRGGHRGRNNWRGAGAESSRSVGPGATLNPNAVPFQPKFNPRDDTSEQDISGNNANHQGQSKGQRSDQRHFENKSERGHQPQRRNRNPNFERDESDGAVGAVGAGITGKPKNQREVLIDQLSRNAYECMVCCEKVRHSASIWSCKRCFNVFHLNCVRKWASSSVDESGWRCPGCQSCYDATPDGYYCFCGKVKNPKSSRYDVPHTCGQTCGKSNSGGLTCTHQCISICHPGPCPSCEVQLVRYCGCGKTSAQVLCGSKTLLCCGATCNKKLSCGVHTCSKTCHSGECESCTAEVLQQCHCGKQKKSVPCTKSSNQCKSYSCSGSCDKPLSCGKHKCDKICHEDPCGPCKTSPGAVISCPCGQTPIDEACKIARLPRRTKCTDQIPTCGKTCLRILPCGDGEKKHCCQLKCHLDPNCPPCKLVSNVLCRCGGKVIAIPCKELRHLEEVTCQKKCNKKRSCGKHKCNSKCCIDLDHICPIVCGRQLRCGNHSCTRLCHLNPCPPCDIVSFDELACECGASIIYPPVPCGTRRPKCLLPCSREHPCEHPVHHPCHSEPNCPPCTVLTEKWCHGKHELRKNIMCHITEVSCGLPCGKMLSCGRHKCPKTCHAGNCLKAGEACKLACEVRKACGHPCGAPCHEDSCPDTKCKVNAEVQCPCGRKVETMVCWRRENEYDRTVTWEYHKELKRLQEVEAKAKKDELQITDKLKAEVMARMKETIPKSSVLECDKECARLERNRKMAEALQIDNADVTTSVGTPNYSEFLTKFAKKNPQFIEMIHKSLTDLVMKAKQSRKKNETYGFNSMNRDKRHVVHEYSDYFGVLSESFDEEPNRNVVCFASREKSYLPSVSLIDAVFRPVVRSERLRPNDDVSFFPEKRTAIVGPSQWNMRVLQKSSNESKMVALGANSGASAPGPASGASSDFPPL